MANITSAKIGRRCGGKAALHMDGKLSDDYPIVFGGVGAVLNLSDGERAWYLRLDDAELDLLAARLAERAVHKMEGRS